MQVRLLCKTLKSDTVFRESSIHLKNGTISRAVNYIVISSIKRLLQWNT